MSTKTFKSQAGREVADADVDTELTRLAEERVALNPKLDFSAAFKLTLRAEPEMARAWLNGHED